MRFILAGALYAAVGFTCISSSLAGPPAPAPTVWLCRFGSSTFTVECIRHHVQVSLYRQYGLGAKQVNPMPVELESASPDFLPNPELDDDKMFRIPLVTPPFSLNDTKVLVHEVLCGQADTLCEIILIRPRGL